LHSHLSPKRSCRSIIHAAATPQSTTDESAYDRSRDAQKHGHNETSRISSWHEQLGNRPCGCTEGDPADNRTHSAPPDLAPKTKARKVGMYQHSSGHLSSFC